MKTAWNRPIIEAQRFTPNEYCAACGETEYGKYLFECNAGDEGSWYQVYEDSNKNEVFDGGDRYISWYHPCHETHEASTTDDFLSGFITWTTGMWPFEQQHSEKVIIWIEDGYDTHCTDKLNRESWQTTKS